MPSGTVKWFNEEKGFGFIEPDTGGEDLFLHYTNIQADGFRTLCKGQRVSYEVTHGCRGVQANYVQSFAEGAASGKGDVEPITDLPLSFPQRESSIDSINLPTYSSTKHYVETPETHEQLAIGDGCSQCSDIDAVVESHSKEMKEKIEINASKIIPGDQKWNYHKEEIHQTYIVQGKTLKETMERMQEKHSWLTASERSWKMKLKSWGFEKHDANEATISQNSITFDPMSSVVLKRSKSEEVQWQASPMVSSSSAKSQFVGNSAILNAATTFQDSRAKDYFPKAEFDDLPLVPEVNKASALPPRSSIAQSSFVQGIPGSHDTHIDTDSTVKVITTVSKTEPKFTTSNSHPASVASEYGASEGAADDASIFSLPDSLSSRSSLHDLLGPIEEFAAMLIDDADLRIHYPSLRQTFKFSEFKSELHRLLKAFSKDLSKEASIPIEKESVRFITQQRRRISHAVGQEVFGLKEKLLFNKITQQQQLDAKQRIEQFLRGATQFEGSDEEHSPARHEQNSESDSSDDEGELHNFPSLKHVKNFLSESKAFEKLRSGVRQLAVHERQTISPGLGTSSYQGLEQSASSAIIESDEHRELSPVKLVREEPKSQIFDKDVQTDEIRSRSNFSPNLKEHEKKLGSQSTVKDQPGDDNYLTAVGRIIRWAVSRYLRPRVKTGYRRLEWQCDCGALIYGNFNDSDPIEVDKLGIELQATGYEPDEQDNKRIKIVPTNQEQPNTSNPIGQAPQIPSAAQPAQAPYTNANAQLTATSPTNLGVGTTSVQTAVLQRPPMTKKFAALCVNTGEFNKTLGEIEVSSINTDRQVFHKFKEKYQVLRGFRAGALRWLLIKPVDIKFIQFAVEDSHRVDIIPKPPDCTLCASDTVIRSRQYEPHLHTSARTHPPISTDAFLHYWQCYSRERSLQRTKWLSRLPKKLDRKLEEVRRMIPTDDDVLGWGILVVEGLNKALVTLLTFLLLLFSGFITIVFSIWRDDVSGGFAIGAYIVALWAALITALYFQWQK